MQAREPRTRAVVIGAGLGGLCAARALADLYAEVLIVERDAVPSGPVDRSGVPQGRHVHALLARGMIELEEIFPGFRRAMVDCGAVETDMGRDAAVLRTYGWAPRRAFGIDLLLASRALIEGVVRERCLAIRNVRLLERTTVVGLPTRGIDRGLRATGVRLAGGVGEIEADLVVDASGRASRAPEWLRELGFEAPAETVVDGHAAYVTRWYEMPERVPEGWWWKSILLEPRPPENWYTAVLVPVESRRWIVTLAGLARHYPPTDEDGFTAALRWLRSPLIADAVALARPISPVYGSRQMSNRFRHYERWRGRLEGFVALGDSVCVFNPIYGQGMTTAAVCARLLADTVRSTDPADRDLAPRFFRAQARAQRDPWSLATGADLRLEATEGPRSRGARLFAAYVEALFLATRDDAVVSQRLFEVLQMLRPASSLLTPAVALRVAAAAIARTLGSGRAARAARRPEGETLRDPSGTG